MARRRQLLPCCLKKQLNVEDERIMSCLSETFVSIMSLVGWSPADCFQQNFQQQLPKNLYLIFFLYPNSDPTPIGKEDQSLAIKWDPIQSSSPNQIPYLDINARLEMKRNPEAERMEFWDDLYQQYNGEFM